MAERTSAGDQEAQLVPSRQTDHTFCPRRITRSSTRQAANQALETSEHSTANTVASPAPAPPSAQACKRKVSSTADKAPLSTPQAILSGRRPKRPKLPDGVLPQQTLNPTSSPRLRGKGKAPVEMDGADGDPPSGPSSTTATSNQARIAPGPREKLSRNLKRTSTSQDSVRTPILTRRHNRTTENSRPDTDATSGADENIRTGQHLQNPFSPPTPQVQGSSNSVAAPEDDHSEDHEDEGDEGGGAETHQYEEHDDDPFGGYGRPDLGLSNTLRALTGIMSGLSSRLRELLANLRQDDTSIQVIALQELSEVLLVSNEDNLSGNFSPDAFIRELVRLMRKEDSPETMLLACRCLANLMEALPASIANVVYGNAVSVLCQKLLEISFIDLAEQALSTLEKISTEYPSSIVREGGLTACLSYLDFFATSTQRTAVTTAANCCRNIPDDSFPLVKDVMPILLNVLGSSDQRVVEQASLCVSGIVESFKYEPGRLEALVSMNLLRTVLRLLVPGTTNLIGSKIHTHFLRVLAFTARASPRLSAALFKLNIVDTLYQMLTGVSPPSGTENVAAKLDSVIVMQALIHRPRDQIVETLNVVCELLPTLPQRASSTSDVSTELNTAAQLISQVSPGIRTSRVSNDQRLELLAGCKEEVRRFALIIFPTLTDAYSSTVNLSVRQKVLTAQLKMLSNLDTNILAEVLTPVPYASFLAAILSQQDHPSLVILGLQATELLLNRLDEIYRYQLYREGVIHEITRLTQREDPDRAPALAESDQAENTAQKSRPLCPDVDDDTDEEQDDKENENMDQGGHNMSTDDVHNDNNENGTGEYDAAQDRDDASPESSQGSSLSLDLSSQRNVADAHSMTSRISEIAERFLEVHEDDQRSQQMKARAAAILNTLSGVAAELYSFYFRPSVHTLSPVRGIALFSQLASFFDTDLLESITSAELLASGLVQTLLDVFSNPDQDLARAAQSTFLKVFMGHGLKARPKTATAESPATPFSVIVHKLQDLLSRSEHFEVITVHHNSFDGSRGSPASMLGKQIRLRLVADEDSNVPRPYRNIMVSIHAIATFKALDDYLRPRIGTVEPPPSARRDGLTRAFAVNSSRAHMPVNSSAAAKLINRPQSRLPDHITGLSMPAPMNSTSSGHRSSGGSKDNVASPPRPPPPEPPETSSYDRPGRHSCYKEALRRSSRRRAISANITRPPRPPPAEDDNPQNILECADEKPITDEDEEEDSSALDAIVGELDENLNEHNKPSSDATAINLKVASVGKFMALKDDGTKFPSPAGLTLTTCGLASPLSSSTSRLGGPSGSAATLPSLTYASALRIIPRDWHIEFSFDGQVISNETTIYRAIHLSTSNSSDLQSRSIWSATHPIQFRRTSGPSAPNMTAPRSNIDAEKTGDSNPASLAGNPTTSSILSLLNLLHELNTNVEDIVAENATSAIRLHVEPLSQFVNTKLTAKLNRQLEEPLIVASSCLPRWSEDLARLYPFLFPFETRHLFLQSTSFGYARSMARWQNSQAVDDNRRDRNIDRPFLGRLQRQKVRISRVKVLESALKVMDLYGASQSILEVEYFEEVGTGLGPTLEFYSTVSKEFSKKKLKIWRELDSNDCHEFESSSSGLFPRPVSHEELSSANGERILHLFKMLGIFVARSMIDSRIIDLHFNPMFFRIGEGSCSGIRLSLGAVKVVDPGLARSLKIIKKFSLAKREIDEDPTRSPAQKVADIANLTVDNVRIDDLCLDFTLPGFPGLELEGNGSQKRVSIENVDSYLDKIIDVTLGSGVRQQLDSFRAGFSQVFPYSALSAFTPEELVGLFGKMDEDWTLATLADSIKADHGYNMDSLSVKNLLQTMAEFDKQQRREFLQFTTGSPKLPIGGFRSLTPMFTVVCKPSEQPYTSDDYLPSVMTCVNYLKLPNYSTLDVMKKQLFTAIKEGQGAFHLS